MKVRDRVLQIDFRETDRWIAASTGNLSHISAWTSIRGFDIPWAWVVSRWEPDGRFERSVNSSCLPVIRIATLAQVLLRGSR